MNRLITWYPYTEILVGDLNLTVDQIELMDHLSGFDSNFNNNVLEKLNNTAQLQKKNIPIIYHNILDKKVIDKYQGLEFKFDPVLQNKLNLSVFRDYSQHPKVNIENFICSFNGSDHVSRKLLTAILYKFKYFNSDYCSKNFVYSINELDGHISNYVDDDDRYYRKFFISADSEDFFQTVNSFGHVRYDHTNNIYNLETKLTQSFLHIVSETLATSYVPFVTEKFLYSVVTRGLFLSYAQPGWHEHLEKYYGFKRYTKLFDYRFDSIQNPIKRLVELMTMIGKFLHLSYDDLYDIYLIELDTINYNYDHYFSGRYLEHLKQYGN